MESPVQNLPRGRFPGSIDIQLQWAGGVQGAPTRGRARSSKLDPRKVSSDGADEDGGGEGREDGQLISGDEGAGTATNIQAWCPHDGVFTTMSTIRDPLFFYRPAPSTYLTTRVCPGGNMV